jgi:chemotaxis protein MotB
MKRQKAVHHENHERWLVSYADFITLMFAFFVVMFATAQKDKTKASIVAESVRPGARPTGFHAPGNHSSQEGRSRRQGRLAHESRSAAAIPTRGEAHGLTSRLGQSR